MIEPYTVSTVAHDSRNIMDVEILRALETISSQLDYSTKMIEEINRPILEKLRPQDYPKPENETKRVVIASSRGESPHNM